MTERTPEGAPEEQKVAAARAEIVASSGGEEGVAEYRLANYDFFLNASIQKYRAYRLTKAAVYAFIGFLTFVNMILWWSCMSVNLNVPTDRFHTSPFWRFALLAFNTLIPPLIFWRCNHPLDKAGNVISAIVTGIIMGMNVGIFIWNAIAYSKFTEPWLISLADPTKKDWAARVLFWSQGAAAILLIVLFILLIVIISYRKKYLGFAATFVEQHGIQYGQTTSYSTLSPLSNSNKMATNSIPVSTPNSVTLNLAGVLQRKNTSIKK